MCIRDSYYGGQQKICNILCGCPQGQKNWSGSFVDCNGDSVSYTHLDVYKRQVLITPIATLVGAIAGGAVAGPFEVARYRYYLCLLYTSRCV